MLLEPVVCCGDFTTSSRMNCMTPSWPAVYCSM
jgi:hypothetical protein